MTDSDVRPYGVHTMIQHIAFSSNGVNEHAKRQQMNLPAMLECAFKQGLRTAQFQPITGNKRSLLSAIQISSVHLSLAHSLIIAGDIEPTRSHHAS